MADEQQNAGAAAGSEGQPEPQMAVQHIYLKDCSFEAPGALNITSDEGAPDVNLNLSQRVNKLDEDRYEVVLTVTLTAKQGDTTAFLAETHQAGVFRFSGYSEEQLHYMINVLCPDVLFPYARAQAGGMIAAGGFIIGPLQPINFQAIYRQRLAEAQAQGQEDGGMPPEPPAG